MNLYVLYKEYFNDSTFVLNITQHGVVFNDTFKSSFTYEGKEVFIFYSVNDNPPFRIPDAGFWSILFKAGEGGNQYQRLDFLNGNYKVTK